MAHYNRGYLYGKSEIFQKIPLYFLITGSVLVIILSFIISELLQRKCLSIWRVV